MRPLSRAAGGGKTQSAKPLAGPPVKPTVSQSAQPSTAAALPVRDAKKRKGRRYAKKAKKAPSSQPATSTTSPSPGAAALSTTATSKVATPSAKRKQSVQAAPTSSWRRVEVNPELLSHTAEQAGGELSGLLLLEEISGAAFQQHTAKYNPNKRYGADDEADKPTSSISSSSSRPSKRRRTEGQRREQHLRLVPQLDSTTSEQADTVERKQQLEAEKDEVNDGADDEEEDSEAQDEDEAAVKAEEEDDDDGVAFDPEDLSADADDDAAAATAEAQRILSQVRAAVPEPDSPPDTAEEEDEQPDGEEEEQDAAVVHPPSSPPTHPPPPSAWDEFGLHPTLLHALHALHFLTPTPIQSACLPTALHQWKDIVAAAPTGCGKTLAFGLPILHHLLSSPTSSPSPSPSSLLASPPCPAALILTPTRELALQVTAHLSAVTPFTPLRLCTLTGGLSPHKQSRLLSSHPHIVVATPGRLWEMITGGEVGGWESLRWLVMDEADRLMEKGHYGEVQQVLDVIERRRTQVQKEGGRVEKLQRFFFSATLTLSGEGREDMRRKGGKRKRKRGEGDEEEDGGGMVAHLVSLCRMSGKPHVVDLTASTRVVATLTEWTLPCVVEDKDFHVYALALQHVGCKVIVFVNAISCLRRLASLLALLALPCYPLHAEMQQRQRLRNLDRFKATPGSILIATDVAARGLDIPAVPLVVHYQLPGSAEVYIHRCGRVARSGRVGVSVAMIGEGDVKGWRRVNAVVRPGGEEVGKWVVDDRVMGVSRERMVVARKLDRVLSKGRQERSKAEWFERKAEEMEMEVDDDVKELLGKGGKGKAKGGRGGEDGDGGERDEAEVKRMKQELAVLLQKKVEDSRVHARFFTLNVAEQLARQEANARKHEATSAKGKKLQAPPAGRGAQVKEQETKQPDVPAVESKAAETGVERGAKGKGRSGVQQLTVATAGVAGSAAQKRERVKVEEEMKGELEEIYTVDGEAEAAELARDAVMRDAVDETAAGAGASSSAGAVGGEGGKKLGTRAKKNLRKKQQKMKGAEASHTAPAAES